MEEHAGRSGTIHERSHLRLWATRYRGNPVWVGTITRDIGVCFTPRAWNLTTHAIDPDVDEAHHYLVEDLPTTESVRSLAMIPGVGEAGPDAPHRNLMPAPFWTDGRRALLWLAPPDEEIPLARVESFGVFRLGESIRELEGQSLEGGTVAGPAEPWDGEDRDVPGDGARD